MKCNTIKESLIDYIDGNMSGEEKNNIEMHLDNCRECQHEYEELLESISYLKESGDRIKTDKDIDAYPVKLKKKKGKAFKRTLLIASIITIFIAFSTFASEILTYFDYWKLSSAERTMAWDELIDAGLGQKLDISVEDSGIRVTAEGVIADDLNTLILLKIEDLNGQTRYGDSYNIEDGVNVAESLEASGDLRKYSDFMLPTAIPISLYQEEEGVNKMIVQMDTMTADKGTINLKIREFMSLVSDEGEFTPLNRVDESRIKRVKGNWDMEIAAEKLETFKYKVDREILLDGNQIKIKNISIAPTETSIEYEFKVFNKEEKYFLESLKLSIEYKGKKYKYPKLGNSNFHHFLNTTNGSLYNTRVSSLETLYLEKPESLDIIINSYKYKTIEKKSYAIDLDDLPQELEYGEAILTVESVRHTDDLSEIVVREDQSEDREYISTRMYIDFPLILDDDTESSIRSYSAIFNTHDAEKLQTQTISVIKAKEGKEHEDSDGFHDNIKAFLKPQRIVIEGQAYVKTPDEKINIELKD